MYLHIFFACRVNGLLAISRALGDVQFKSEKEIDKGLVIATPEIHAEVITPMTEFAVAATDGLWDVFDAQSVINFIRKRLNKKIDLQQVSQEVVEEALRRGSVDNITVALMVFNLNRRTSSKSVPNP
jgi:protein phosphatase 2C family protein 2/3